MSALCRSLLVAGALAVTNPAEAACEAPVPLGDLAQSVTAGDVAFADMDAEAYMAARNKALQELPCVGGPMTTGHAASYHRMLALGSFLDREHASTVASFRSLLAASPGYILSDDLAPEGHPLRLYFSVAEGTYQLPGAFLPMPTEGSLVVDGRETAEAPLDRPYIFQYMDEDGALVTTSLVQPGIEPPSYPGSVVEEARRSGGKSALSKPLWATAGTAAVASGVFYAVAWSSSKSFWDAGTPNADLAGLRKRTNTMSGLALGAGVVALGAGAGAVLVGEF